MKKWSTKWGLNIKEVGRTDLLKEIYAIRIGRSTSEWGLFYKMR